MDRRTIDNFGKLLMRKNPRSRRGFLDSLYAELIQGKIYTADADVIERAAGLLHNFGFHNHVAKLLEHPCYSEKRPIIGQRVDAIGTHFAGPAAGYDTLSLGERIVNCGSDWSVSEPVSYCVVPIGSHRFGEIIRTMPKGVAPVCAFFPEA